MDEFIDVLTLWLFIATAVAVGNMIGK
jgi:hypothetical protein|nr:MAG: hypothetical protein [Bacteriophage sp.]